MILNKLKLNPKNPRTISKDKFEKLKKSIKEFPQMLEVRPIVYDDSYIVLGGNMRLRALQDLTKAGFEVKESYFKKISDITPEQAREFVIKDNIELGEWDDDILANEWSDLPLEEWGIDTSGWKSDEVIEDDPPEVQEEPISKLGEVYQLGRYRLLCGDSTKIEDVEKLMNEQKADMVLTDPPYGIALETNYSIRNTSGKDYNGLGTKYGTRGNYSKVIGDDKPYDPAHLFNMFPDVKEMFLSGADYYSDRLVDRDKGSWYCWDKRFGIEDIKFSASEFEMYWSKTKHLREIIRERWFGAHGTQNQDIAKRSHPTQKPLGVNAFFIKKFSKDGDIIADVFGGTGSCLIACEQLNRTCYMMEIDPKYTDVIRKRYAKFIGREEEWEKITPKI